MTRFNAKNGGLMTRKVTIRLDEKRFEELDNYAMQEGTSVSFIVRHLVVRFLENQRRLSVVTPIGEVCCYERE